MKLTYSNYQTEIQNLDWAKIPKNIAELKDDLQEQYELYHDDKDIAEAFDLTIEKINASLKNEVKPAGNIIVATIPKYDFVDPEKSKPASAAKPKNLGEFKKWLKSNIGTKLFFVWEHSMATKSNVKHMDRIISIVQSNSFAGKTDNNTDSWMQYGSAKDWEFTNKYAKNTSSTNTTLTYYYDKPDFYENGKNDWGLMEEDKPAEIKHVATVSKEIVEYFKTHNSGETHLYNNRRTYQTSGELTNLQSVAQYNVNHKWIESNKPAAKKKPIKEVVSKDIFSHFNIEYTLLNKFYNLVTKTVPVKFRAVQLLYMAFEKNAIDRKIRKTSVDAELYNTCNDKLVKLYTNQDPKKESFDITFTDKEFLEKLRVFVKTKQVDPAVNLLKSVISLQGIAPDDNKVEKLIKSIENAIANGKVKKDNRLYDDLLSAKKELKSYLDGNVKKVPTKSHQLSGVHFPIAIQRKIDELNKLIAIAIKEDIHVSGYFGSTMSYVYHFKKPVVVKNQFVTIEYNDVGWGKAKPKKERFNITNSESKSDLMYNLNTLIKMIKRGIKDDGNSIRGEKPTVKKKVVTKKIVKSKPTSLLLKDPAKLNAAFTDKGLENAVTLPVILPAIKGLKPVSNRIINNVQRNNYKITGDIAALLGNIEIKPVDSVAVTLDAPQGSGKTRFFFQAANEFASKGYKVLFVTCEEHPQSALFQDKLDQYIDVQNQNSVFAIDESNYETIAGLIPSFDIIFIDSWNKIIEKNKGVDFDNDLRKKFNGKLFFAIFQRTTTGSMRGGSKAQFDGDVILKIVKEIDFKENYIVADKNRYQNADIHEIKYNIYYQKIIGSHTEPEETSSKVFMQV